MKWIGKSIKGPIIIYKGEFKLWGGGGGGGGGLGGSVVYYQTTRVGQE